MYGSSHHEAAVAAQGPASFRNAWLAATAEIGPKISNCRPSILRSLTVHDDIRPEAISSAPSTFGLQQLEISLWEAGVTQPSGLRSLVW